MSQVEIQKTEKKKVEQKDERTWAADYFVPEVDIFETDEAIVLDAEMPGVRKGDLSIDVRDDVLTIEGRIALDGYTGKRLVYSEYPVGNYYRRFELGKQIDQNRIEAATKDGVLTVTLPKVPKAMPRKIAVI